MTSIFDGLSQTIHENYLKRTNIHYKIVEDQVGCSCKFVTINRLSKNFAFSLDISGEEPFPFFKDTKGIKQRNDAILFCEYNQQLYVLIMELKSNNPFDGIKQLRAGKNFVRYIIETLNLNFAIQPSTDSIIYKNIIFTTNPSSTNRPVNARRKAFYRSIGDIDVAFEKCNTQYNLDYFL